MSPIARLYLGGAFVLFRVADHFDAAAAQDHNETLGRVAMFKHKLAERQAEKDA